MLSGYSGIESEINTEDNLENNRICEDQPMEQGRKS